MWQNNNKLQRKTMPTGDFHANFFFEMSPSKEPRMKRFVFVCCLQTLFVEQHTSRVLTLSFFYCFLWSEVFPHPATIKSFLMFAMVLNVATCHFLSAPLIITAHHTRKTRTGETNEFPSPPFTNPEHVFEEELFRVSLFSPAIAIIRILPVFLSPVLSSEIFGD